MENIVTENEFFAMKMNLDGAAATLRLARWNAEHPDAEENKNKTKKELNDELAKAEAEYAEAKEMWDAFVG